jgi:hypothetical protein
VSPKASGERRLEVSQELMRIGNLACKAAAAMAVGLLPSVVAFFIEARRMNYYSPISFLIRVITSGGCTITSFASPSNSAPLISSGSRPLFLASAIKSA